MSSARLHQQRIHEDTARVLRRAIARAEEAVQQGDPDGPALLAAAWRTWEAWRVTRFFHPDPR
jgi:hypothetical protein